MTPFQDVRRWFPEYEPRFIFDVGANVGQSCLAYASLFPRSRIHAFEPAPAAFEQLKKNVAATPTIMVWPFALSSTTGSAALRSKGASTSNRIIKHPSASVHAITVPTTTGEQFCEQHKIENISYLKVDTEGHDLEVLRGFETMLDRIDFVQVEASANRYNTKHVWFRDFEEYLSRSFWLFKHYDQRFEFANGGKPVLRRTNPVFINKALVRLSE